MTDLTAHLLAALQDALAALEVSEPRGEEAQRCHALAVSGARYALAKAASPVHPRAIGVLDAQRDVLHYANPRMGDDA